MKPSRTQIPDRRRRSVAVPRDGLWLERRQFLDDDPTSASATETWASGVCSSITTWQGAVKSAAASVKSDPTKSGLQTAAGDAKSATQTLASDLKGLGKPDTPAGQQAKLAR